MSLRAMAASRPKLVRLLFLLTLIGLCVVNYLTFPAAFGTSYLSFYTKAGAAVALGVLLMELSWKDLCKHAGLASTDPVVYVGSMCQLIGLPLFVLGAQFEQRPGARPRSAWDVLFCLPFFLVVLCGLAVWLVAIAPVQYFVNFVCGAPARLLSASNAVVHARLRDGWQLETAVRDVGQPAPEDRADPWWDAGMRGKEHRLTSAYSAVMIVALGWALSALGRS